MAQDIYTEGKAEEERACAVIRYPVTLVFQTPYCTN